AGCATEQEDDGVPPLGRRLPLSARTMQALGGAEVARLLLGPDTRDLAVDRMRLNGDRRHGPGWVTFPERRARPLIDGRLYEGLCSVRLRRLVMTQDGRDIEDIERPPGRIVLGDVRVVEGSDPAFDRRVADSRAACANWSRSHPQAWFVQEDQAVDLVPVVQGLADLPAAIAAGRIDCGETCGRLSTVVANRELTGAANCNPIPGDGADELCVIALFDSGEGGYTWDEARMTGPAPAPDQPFRPTRAGVETLILMVN
ncbi:MAG: hypothetical protein U1C74_01425, partial [Phenylobacterium sp.]|nr:hypothetical protein [Phenylobacterium sp.]